MTYWKFGRSCVHIIKKRGSLMVAHDIRTFLKRGRMDLRIEKDTLLNENAIQESK